MLQSHLAIRRLMFIPLVCVAGLMGSGLAGSAMADFPIAVPNPVVQSLSLTGPVPFTVHVHALSGSVGVGDVLTTRYEWNFGNPGAEYNTLVGWSAAHTYNLPGTYTITLRVTNQNGQSATTSRQVTVHPAGRSLVYVSPTGHDSNPGTESAPIQSFERAAQLVTHNRTILFRRGATFHTNATMNIAHENVLVGAYGSGADPVINFTSGANFTKIIDMSGSARDVVIENLNFTSNFTPNNMIVRAVQPKGTNVTVRNCRFGNISYAINCGGGGVNGLMLQNNTAPWLGAYFSWAEGANHVYLGNTVGGSEDEHNIRFGGVTRALIAHNDLTNEPKATLWTMLGEHAYIANNTMRQGRVITGPNFATSSIGERFRWLVFENNRIINHGVVVYSGSENMVFRNNVIINNGGEIFAIRGWLSTWQRTARNITIANNTAINESSQYGRFVKTEEGVEDILIINNIYSARNLNSVLGAGNVIVWDSNLNQVTSRNNLWANQASGNHVHSIGYSGRTAPQWASFTQTSNENYRSFVASDFNNQHVPQFAAAMGVAVAGVFTDFHGSPRPNGQAWTVGAVERDPIPNNRPGDVNGDGVVNVNDLLAVMLAWGACPTNGACPADVTGDGFVNVNDLLVVIQNWGV